MGEERNGLRDGAEARNGHEEKGMDRRRFLKRGTLAAAGGVTVYATPRVVSGRSFLRVPTSDPGGVISRPRSASRIFSRS